MGAKDSQLGDGQIHSKYKLWKVIGKGKDAEVYEATQIETGKDVAVKKYLINLGQQEERKKLDNEMKALKKIKRCPYIIEYYDYAYYDGNLYVFQELACETLEKFLKKERPSKEKTIQLVEQLLKGMKVINSKKILHRDIKPENILIGYDQKLKIADFGFAREFTLQMSSKGTPLYAPPQYLEARQDYNLSFDIWSCGCVIYEIITRSKFFSAVSYLQLQKCHQSIKAKDYSSYLKLAQGQNPGWGDLIKRMIVYDIDSRCTIDQALNMLETIKAKGKIDFSDIEQQNKGSDSGQSQVTGINWPELISKSRIELVSTQDLSSLQAKIGYKIGTDPTEKRQYEYQNLEEMPDLSSYCQLKFLSLHSNKISSIKGLLHCRELRTLRLSQNALKNIDGLINLTNLTSLSLEYNQLTKICGLSKMEKLSELYLNNNSIMKIRGLITLSNLKLLALNNNRIFEIEGLESLKKLNKLWLGENKIQKIQGLQTLAELTHLYLHHNSISAISGLEKLEKISQLWLSNNQVQKIQGLQKLKNLSKLYFHENRIKEIGDGLKANLLLQYLSIHTNQIPRIDGVSHLSNLSFFDIRKNHIKKLEGISQLFSLTTFYFDKQIKNYDEIPAHLRSEFS